ncbi:MULTISPECIES: DUF6894 family protein [Bradyrhizobium]|uniref:DUF6894 family protein n=1 Tax=Bradyrhizobium TaxID=374 RepID=UPI00155F078A|nr:MULTISPECIES: hypothetical protein [Bradyrhizobium]MDD1519990.1 hypothetical protein [Bradyrhizobium sp. WBAH30]MDD1544234.1 hypothetical protein [Bradyrhizobium sp. WBAH41]MDD1558116.1 hypothetical protein [Bradyrhizobium sp. WBAH23]MDD1565514.1 hypothetical protein [Bradyrhizobium sp. WBAH33]MDD1590644.1 hypothetical protein [Bradyrhizobium sp. WBAH42]
MQKFYFDHIENGNVLTDQDGSEFPGIAEASMEARLSLGEEARTFLSRGKSGRLAVVVRDEHGAILEHSAVIEQKILARTP